MFVASVLPSITARRREEARNSLLRNHFQMEGNFMIGKNLLLLAATGLFLPIAAWPDSISVSAYSGNSDRQLHSGLSTNTGGTATGRATSQRNPSLKLAQIAEPNVRINQSCMVGSCGSIVQPPPPSPRTYRFPVVSVPEPGSSPLALGGILALVSLIVARGRVTRAPLG